MMDFIVLPGLGDHTLQQAFIAALIVACAFTFAHLVARKLSVPLVSWWEQRATYSGEAAQPSFCAIIRWMLALFLLAAASAIPLEEPAARLIFAVATGIAAALLIYRLARSAGTNGFITTLLGLLALFIGTVAVLRGPQPLLQGLNATSLTVGSSRISLLSVLNALLVIVILFVVARLAIRLLGQSINRLGGLDNYQRVLFQKLVAVGVVIAALLVGIDLLGIDLTALAVFSGAFGLAIGFGLQKTFGNLLSGLILLMDRSIKPGDVIVVGETFGWVNKIGVRAVSVITRDGKEHLIPNELLMTERVENWSYSSRDVRIRIPVGVAYDSNLEIAEELMIKAAAEAPRVLSNPAPNVWLRTFGERSVEYDILIWISDPEQGVGNVQSEILGRIWRSFHQNGIKLPFPQRDVHIRSIPDGFITPSDGNRTK